MIVNSQFSPLFMLCFFTQIGQSGSNIDIIPWFVCLNLLIRKKKHRPILDVLLLFCCDRCIFTISCHLVLTSHQIMSLIMHASTLITREQAHKLYSNFRTDWFRYPGKLSDLRCFLLCFSE